MGRKLKQKIILGDTTATTQSNNIPCENFNLDIVIKSNSQYETPKLLVDFIYTIPTKYHTKYTTKKLTSQKEVEDFFRFLLQNDIQLLNCTIEDFIFKNIFSDLTPNELEIFRKSREKYINKFSNTSLKKYYILLDDFLKKKKNIKTQKRNLKIAF